MTISKSDFNNWKADPVTKAFFEATNIRVEDAKEILSYSAGISAVEDSFWRGFIAAYREMPDFKIDDLENVDGN